MRAHPAKFCCVLSVSINSIIVAATSSKKASLHCTLHGWSASLTLRCTGNGPAVHQRRWPPVRFSNAMNLLIYLKNYQNLTVRGQHPETATKTAVARTQPNSSRMARTRMISGVYTAILLLSAGGCKRAAFQCICSATAAVGGNAECCMPHLCSCAACSVPGPSQADACLLASCTACPQH